MPQVPLDYQGRSDEEAAADAAARRRRWKLAAVWWGLGVLIAPLGLIAAYILFAFQTESVAGPLLFPYVMLLSGATTRTSWPPWGSSPRTR